VCKKAKIFERQNNGRRNDEKIILSSIILSFMVAARLRWVIVD